jgi:hypothetical protein
MGAPSPEQMRVSGLQPRAAPVETYARPAQAPKDDSLDRIAASLSGLNRSMLNYVETVKGPAQEDSNDRLMMAMTGKDSEGIRQVLAEHPDARGRIGAQLVSSALGRTQGQELLRNLETRYATDFDRDNGDIDQFINEQAREFVAANADNPAVIKEFTRVWEPGVERIRNGHAEWRAGRAVETVESLVTQSWLAGSEAAMAEGQTPEQVYDGIIRGTYDTNRDFFGLDFQRQDALLGNTIRILENRAEADPDKAGFYYELANTIMTRERVGGDGTKLGAFGDSAEGMKVQSHIDRMRANQAKRELAAGYQVALQAVDARIEDAVDNGNLHRLGSEIGPIIDDRGNQKVFTQAEINERAAQRIIERDQQIFGRSDTDPKMSFNRLVDQFTRNPGMKHPQWAETLGAGSRAVFTVVEGQSIPPILKESVDLYRQIKARSPNHLSVYTSGNDRTFFETADMLLSTGVYDNDEQGKAAAITMAVRATADPDKTASVWSRYSSTEVKAALDSARAFWTTSQNIYGSDLANDFMEETEKLARVFSASTNMGPTQAIEAARERVQANYRTIRGGAVRVNPGAVPGNFDDLVETYLTEYAAKHGYEDEDVAIVSAPNTDNIWQITVDGVIADIDPYLSVNDIFSVEQRLRAEELERIRLRSESRRGASQEAPTIISP